MLLFKKAWLQRVRPRVRWLLEAVECPKKRAVASAKTAAHIQSMSRRAYPLLATSIAKDTGGVHKKHEQLFLYPGRNSKMETCKRAVPSESNGVDRRDPVLKLSQLLLAAAILIALVLLAFEMMLS